MKLKGQMVIPTNVEAQENEIEIVDHFDIDLNDFDKYIKEYDKDTIRNIRRNLGLVLELINDYTQILPNMSPARSKHEVRGGYRIASRRGARLDEVEVFNLYFKFISHLRGDGIALMYRTQLNQERIILLPDDTEKRYLHEQRSYLDVARR